MKVPWILLPDSDWQTNFPDKSTIILRCCSNWVERSTANPINFELDRKSICRTGMDLNS